MDNSSIYLLQVSGSRLRKTILAYNLFLSGEKTTWTTEMKPLSLRRPRGPQPMTRCRCRRTHLLCRPISVRERAGSWTCPPAALIWRDLGGVMTGHIVGDGGGAAVVGRVTNNRAMYRALIGCAFVVLLLCQRWRVHAAPTQRNAKHHAPALAVITIVVDDKEAPRMLADAAGETYVIERAAGDRSLIEARQPMRSRRVRRSHIRHAQSADGATEDSAVTSSRRRRSVAIFWVQASIELCNNDPIRCRSIVVVDGDSTVKIRLLDE